MSISSVMLFLLLSMVASYFFQVAVSRKTMLAFRNSETSQTVNVGPTPIDAAGNKWVNQHGYDTWQIKTKDGLILKGYYIQAEKPTVKTVILAHGYTAQGKDMGRIAKFYYEKLGYNVLMPDDRGHGYSEGNYIGFGWLDRKDYLKWIDQVIKKVGKKSEIVLHGISMGGATVMMVSGEKLLPTQVKAIIEDCGYTTVDALLKYQLGQLYDLPDFPIIEITSIMTKIRAGYDFEEASSINQVKKDKVPILFIHGGKDKVVPVKMVYELYDACKAPKQLLVVKNADHAMSYYKAKSVYQKKVIHFLEKYIPEE